MSTSLHDKSTVEEIRKRFDKDVERFSNLETGQQAIMDATLMMSLITKAAAGNNPQARTLLDIGCGAGNSTLKMLDYIQPLQCDLVDLSAPMLKRAQSRIEAVNSGRIRTFQGDFRMVALPAEHYDIIISAAVLHHLRDEEDWEQAFQKIYDLTAPGGSIWITDFVHHKNEAIQKMMWSRFSEHLESLGGPEYRQKVFEYIDQEDSPRSLEYQLDLLQEVGFEDIQILHKNACFVAFGAMK